MKNGDIVKRQGQGCGCEFEVTNLTKEGMFRPLCIKLDDQCKADGALVGEESLLSFDCPIELAELIREGEPSEIGKRVTTQQ